MLLCTVIHLFVLFSYLFLRHSPIVKSKYLRAFVHSLFLILLSLQENQSYVKIHPEPLNKTKNIPWVQNSIVYTQRFHFPNKKDRLTRRSISYHSNIIGNEGMNSIDMDKYMYGGRIELPGNNISPFNMSNFISDPNQFTKFSSKEETFASEGRSHSRFNENPGYALKNTLKRQEMKFMNDVFNYYEKFEDHTFFDDDYHEHQKLNSLQKKDETFISDADNEIDDTRYSYKLKKDKIKGSYDELVNALEAFASKNRHSLKKATKLKSQNPSIVPSKTATDRIGGLGLVGGPVITSHVVATSIHPWLFPLLYTVSEPYMSFLVFIIITIVECFAIFVGFKLELLGIRATDPPPPNYEKASSVTIVDLCAAVTCANPGETCVEGICKCGTRATCAGVASGAYCDAANNQCKCSETVDSCSGTTDTCTSGVCKCGSNNACSISGETCSSGSCKCGTASSCSGQTSGAYCDAANNVCKCSATVDACSGTTDTCDSGTCKCGSAAACSNSGETCQSGACKCGTAATCVGQTSGTFCDATNNVCKCSSTVDACTGTTDTCDSGTCKCGTAAACSNSGETCQSGTCKCGTATTCVGSSTAPFCDAANNICKCSASVAACSSGEECSGGTCVTLCSPECTLTTDTCASLNNCKCGTADPCGPTLSNRCLNSVCVCGVSASCTAGTTVPVCLDQVGNTPGATNTVATCKCNSNSLCRTGTGADSLKPFCGTLVSALGANVVPVGVCGQCQIQAGGGGGPSDCTATTGTCVQGSCETGELCCKTGACQLLRSECGS